MASKREALSCRPELDGEFRGGASVAKEETRVVSVLMHARASRGHAPLALHLLCMNERLHFPRCVLFSTEPIGSAVDT